MPLESIVVIRQFSKKSPCFINFPFILIRGCCCILPKNEPLYGMLTGSLENLGKGEFVALLPVGLHVDCVLMSLLGLYSPALNAPI